jgi:hypothetical protein
VGTGLGVATGLGDCMRVGHVNWVSGLGQGHAFDTLKDFFIVVFLAGPLFVAVFHSQPQSVIRMTVNVSSRCGQDSIYIYMVTLRPWMTSMDKTPGPPKQGGGSPAGSLMGRTGHPAHCRRCPPGSGA